jgi:hypothetical protein
MLTDRAAAQDGPNSDLLRNLLKYGLLKSSGDYYTIAARYANGLLTVNGASLPVPSQPAKSQMPDVESIPPSNLASGG